MPGSDVRANIPSVDGSAGVIDLTATITNLGPSTVVGGDVGGQFQFTTYQETGTNVTGLTLTSSATTCTTFNTGDGFAATCPLPLISPTAPYDVITVNIHVTYQPTGCPFSIPTSYRAVSRWNDPDLVNNGQDGRVIHCQG